ncbi:MAG: chromosomal replication initiator protein DnaA [bacterium]
MDTHQLWQATLGELELKLSKAHFTTWFRNTFIANFDESQVVIGVPNTFTKAWLEKKYHKEILNSIQNIIDKPIKVLTYRVETRTIAPIQILGECDNAELQQARSGDEDLGFTTASLPAPAQAHSKGFINTNYTFDTFVVGKQNELAYAAAQAVAAQPGGTYNPVFVYGDVGLGKTHLLHSIGNEMVSRKKDTRVLYVTCEQFTNDFIQAVRTGKAKEFKDRYRTVDLLLIDDIQFITGKEGTQEEFFHTFNELHNDNKQIVISSDRPPKAIAALEKRLLSRLEWGMLVDIGAPDLETRIAILQIKCQDKGASLDREILHHIASRIQSNVRELEGALNKIIAVHQFKNLTPSVETVAPILESFELSNIKRTVSAKQIICTVSEYFDIAISDVLGKSREKRLAFPRQIIMFLLREEMRSSYPSIGSELGGRDHTTAMHAYTKILNQIKEDEQLKRDLDLIKQKLYSG